MKLRTLLPAFLLIVGVALCAASHAKADYVLWTPTVNGGDQTLFSFNLAPQICNMNADLYINANGYNQDTSSPGSALLLQMSAGQTYSAMDFSIEQQTNGSWSVYNTTNPASPQLLLSLGSTNQFGLYYYYAATGVDQPTYTQQTYDQWLLNQGLCNPVLITDAAPNQTVGSATPIPGTFLLFGSGLAGAIGFLRRFSS